MEINTEEKIKSNIDLDWQLGSKTPPKVCLCCGAAFDKDKRKILGPYYDLPYIWICNECHEKEYLYSSDKDYSITNFKEVIKNIEKSKLSVRNKIGNQKIFIDTSIDTLNQTQFIPDSNGTKNEIPLKYIPLVDLKLDSENIRFRHIGNELSEQKMEELIWKESDILMLYRDIKNTLGIIEPLFIDSQNIVMEGNRRLVCLRKITRDIRSDVAKDMPIQYFDPVPCRIIPDNLLGHPKEEFLARVHIGGKKPWRALDQAYHLHELFNVYGKSLEYLSDITSLTKKTVIDSIRSYEITSEYHKRYPGDNEWVSKFSYFVELIKKPALKEWLENKENIYLVMKWIAERQIIRGDEIRMIPTLIQNNEALSKMKNGEKLKIAIMPTYTPNKTNNLDKKTKEILTVDNTQSDERQVSIEEFFNIAKEIIKTKGNIQGKDINKLKMIRNEIDKIINSKEK